MGKDDTLRQHEGRIATLEMWRKSIDDQKLDGRIRMLELWKNTILGVIIFTGWMFTTVGKEVLGLIVK